MSTIKCPWDDSGKLLPGVTVRQYLQFLKDSDYSGNITINGVYYNLHNLLIATPDDVNLDAVVTALDTGYYGTPGVTTNG